MKKTAQQQTAANPAISVWVRANAGTGKTRVLTDRVLRLLLDGTAPSRILCLTFTKAAAAEMAKRIYEDLGNWARMEDGELAKVLLRLRGKTAEADLDEARRLFAHALDVPGGLKIQTIHSFCESLLARFPVEAGVVPHFAVMDDRTAAELLQEAREDVYLRASKAADSELASALEAITGHVSESTFTGVLGALLQERGKLRRNLLRHGGPNGMAEMTRKHLGLSPDSNEKTIFEAASREAAFDAKALRQAVEALLEGGAKDRARGETIQSWLAAPDRRAADFDTYLGAFFTEKGERSKPLAHKDTLKACPEATDILAAEATRLEAVREQRQAVIIAEATAALLRLGDALLKTYEASKNQAALLDYDDLILEARRLLEREGIAPWVLFKLDGGIDHILVDEAQDTNPDQWRVIASLASEFFTGASAREGLRTVFAVGDAKQSIFSFQRADPRSFREMRDYFAARVQAADERWRDVPLELSFRSAPAILKAVDAIFHADEARDGVSLEGEKIKHGAAREGQGGLVEIWPPEAKDEKVEIKPWTLPLKQERVDVPEKLLAEKIARQIRKWLDTKEKLPSRDRAIRPGDILVLVRRRNRFFEELVRMLKVYAIPVAGMDHLVLTNHLAVRDLIAFGRFVLFPEDDLTLAAILKSPLIGLDETALLDLAHEREESLWDALRTRHEERKDFSAAHAMLAANLAKADYVPPFEFYASLLGPGGGRVRLIARLGHEAGDPIDEFLNLALAYEKIHVPAMEGFLHWIEAGETKVKRDLEQGRDEVRVMTVHGAKGLEAPIVFLPDTCQMPEKDAPLFWLGEKDAETTVLWAPRRAQEEKMARKAREMQRRLREQEYRRLLYVALTRAQDRLYVAGWEPRKPGCWYDLIVKELEKSAHPVSLAIGGEGLRFEEAQKAPPDQVSPLSPLVSGEDALPVWARHPAPPEPLASRTLTPSKLEGSAPAGRSPVGPDSGARFHRGRIVHRLLQFLPELAGPERPSAAWHYLSEKRHALKQDDQQAMAKEVLAILETGAFAPLFGPGSRAEVPIIGEINGQAITGQVDRLLVTEETVLVVDYKTEEPPATPEETPEIYLRQMAAYMSLLSKIFPGRETRAALLWTAGPNLMPLKGEFLRPYAP